MTRSLEHSNLVLTECQYIKGTISGQQRQQRLDMETTGNNSQVTKGIRRSIVAELTRPDEDSQPFFLVPPKQAVIQESPHRSHDFGYLSRLHTLGMQLLLSFAHQVFQPDRILPEFWSFTMRGKETQGPSVGSHSSFSSSKVNSIVTPAFLFPAIPNCQG
jgi:hypothetical protein